LRLQLKKLIDNESKMFCGVEFQTTGAVKVNALLPTALIVRGTFRRLRMNEEACEGYYFSYTHRLGQRILA